MINFEPSNLDGMDLKTEDHMRIALMHVNHTHLEPLLDYHENLLLKHATLHLLPRQALGWEETHTEIIEGIKTAETIVQRGLDAMWN